MPPTRKPCLSSRTVIDAKEAFEQAETVGKTEPTVVFTDGLLSYSPATQGVFPNAVHVSGMGIQGRVNNNRMERYHGTFKERSKVMRAINNPNSPFLDGQRVYYDYIRPHTALNGKTPAEAAGIKIEGENKWLTLIRNAKEQHERS